MRENHYISLCILWKNIAKYGIIFLCALVEENIGGLETAFWHYQIRTIVLLIERFVVLMTVAQLCASSCCFLVINCVLVEWWCHPDCVCCWETTSWRCSCCAHCEVLKVCAEATWTEASRTIIEDSVVCYWRLFSDCTETVRGACVGVQPKHSGAHLSGACVGVQWKRSVSLSCCACDFGHGGANLWLLYALHFVSGD